MSRDATGFYSGWTRTAAYCETSRLVLEGHERTLALNERVETSAPRLALLERFAAQHGFDPDACPPPDQAKAEEDGS